MRARSIIRRKKKHIRDERKKNVVYCGINGNSWNSGLFESVRDIYMFKKILCVCDGEYRLTHAQVNLGIYVF